MFIYKKDLHYSFDTKGYMIYYKDYPIGGAGIDKYLSGCRANLKLFKEEAEQDIYNILNGYGQKRYYDNIRDIEDRIQNIYDKEHYYERQKNYLDK